MLSQLSTWIPAAAVLFYVYTTYCKLHQLANPLEGVDVDALRSTGMVVPLWKEGDTFKLIAFLSHTDRFYDYEISSLRLNNNLLIERRGLTFNASESEIKINLKIVTSKSSIVNETENAVVASKKVWNNIRKISGTSNAYLHIHIIRSSKDGFAGDIDKVNRTFLTSGDSLYGVVPMAKLDKTPKHFKQRYLLSDFGLIEEDDLQKQRLNMDHSIPIPYWKPEVSVKLITDFTEYPRDHYPLALEKDLVPNTKYQRTFAGCHFILSFPSQV